MVVKDAYQDVIREIQIMKELDHVCVIRLHEVIDDPDGDKLYMSKQVTKNFSFNRGVEIYHIIEHWIIVMDYAYYGQIMQWDSETLKFSPCLPDKEFFSEKDIQKILRDCIRALDSSNIIHPLYSLVHNKGIVHRDIKP